MRKGKFILSFTSFSILALSLFYTEFGITGCKNVDKISDSLIFRYNEDATVSTLDPVYVRNQSEIWIVQQLYSRLVELDSFLKPQPGIARRWEILDSGRVYKFYMRQGIHFYSAQGKNKLLTAADVVYTFKRLCDPKTASPSAWIFNGKILECNACKPAFEAESDSVFILRLNKPDPTMLASLGTVFCSILPEQQAGSKPDFGRNPCGTGPFYLKLWEEDVRMVLRKNPNYFEFENGIRLPYLEAVNIDFIKNKQTAFMRFVAGEYDFFNGVEGSFKDELLTPEGNLKPAYHKFNMLRKPFLNTEYLGFWLGNDLNGQANIFQNRHLRRALSLAINRKEMIRYLRNGIGEEGRFGFTPPVLLGAQVQGFGHNPRKAAEELNQAGYPGGKGLPQLEMTTTADYLDMAIFIKKAWADIGVNVKVDVQTGGMLRQLRNQGKLGIFRGSWIADIPDAENYLTCFSSENHSPSGPNYTHYSNMEVDKVIKLSYLASGDMRQKLLRTADSLVIADAPVIVLYYDQSVRLMQKKVQGLSNDAANRLILKMVRKKS